MRPLSFIVPMVLLGACGGDMLSSASGSWRGVSVPVSFTLDAESFVSFPTPPAVMPANGGIVIEGHLAFPVACAQAGAAADRDAHTVHVVVAIIKESPASGLECPTAVRDAQYRAAVTLPPGTYHVVLIHEVPGASAGDEIVFDGDVRVS